MMLWICAQKSDSDFAAEITRRREEGIINFVISNIRLQPRVRLIQTLRSRRSKPLESCQIDDPRDYVGDLDTRFTLIRVAPQRYIRNKVIRLGFAKVSATIDTERPIETAICGSTRA